MRGERCTDGWNVSIGFQIDRRRTRSYGRRPVSLRFAILGLLADEPRHGYAIQAALERHFGDVCEPSCGAVYRVLDALARDRMVSAAEARSGNRPRRKVFSLTPAGRAALDRWLVGATAATRSRDDTWLRLLVAERVAPELLPRLLDGLLHQVHGELDELEAQRRHLVRTRSFADLVRALRLVSALRHARARAGVLVLCRTTLVRLAAGASVADLVRRILGENDDAMAATSGRPQVRPPRA